MKYILLPLLVLIGTSVFPQSTTQIVLNGSFSNGFTDWSASGGWNGPFHTYPGCSQTYYALTSDASGNGVNNYTAILTQTVTMPSNPITATLSFCYYTISDNASVTSAQAGMYVYFNNTQVATVMISPTDVAGGAYNSSGTISLALPSGSTAPLEFYAYDFESGSNYSKIYLTNVQINVTYNNCTAVTISNQPQNQTVCAGNPATFSVSANGTGPFSYFWYGPNGQISGATNSTYTTPDLTSANNGNCYYCKITNCSNQDGVTSGTACVTVTSNPPVPSVSSNPSSICPGGTSTLTVTESNCNGCSYSWSGGLGSSTSVPVHPTASTGYSVTVTNSCNLSTSNGTYVTVDALPATPTFSSPTTGCGTVAVSATSSGSNFTWANGQNTATDNFTSSGTYQVTATNGSGCTASASVNVTVNPNPTVTITPANQTGCTGQQISFAASGGSAYTWSGQGVSGQTNSTVTNTYNTSGTYTVTASGTQNGCSASATASVIINTQPSTPIAFNPAAPNGCGSVTVTAASGNCGGNCTYDWSNNVSTAQNTITTTGTNVYTVTVSGGGNCTTTGTVSVTVNTQPLVTSITPTNNNNGTYCQNQSLTLTANATGGTTYAWNGQGVSNSSPGSPTTTATPTQGGNIPYGVTVTNGNCSAQGTVNVNVTQVVTPSVSFSQLPTPVCTDGQQSVTITANATNGGTNPSYNWSSSCPGNQNSNTYDISNIIAPCSVSCTLTSNAACATVTTATATTNVQETSPLPASLTISIVDTNVCITDQAQFTSIPVNSGGSPTYNWFVDAVQVGTGSTFSYTFPATGTYSVNATLVSSLACFTPPVAQSNTLIITVTGQATPAVTISASGSTICAGSADTVIAIPSTGGNNPTYQWYLNNQPSGNNTGLYTSSTIHNSDAVYCVMTSSSSCATTSTATSNTVSITVDSLVRPHVSITANPTGATCADTPVTFTATSTNGGTNPVYEWLTNGNYQATTGNTFTDNAALNNNVITCVLISNATCATPDSAVSNSLTEVVDTAVTPMVSIAANTGNTVCIGTGITFTATPVHAGSAPQYQWLLNGNPVGTDSSSFSSSLLSNGDIVSCSLTSNAACATSNTATSNAITVSITSSVNPTISIAASPNGTVCPGTPITFTVTNISGEGPSPVYQWQVRPNGGNAGNGTTTFIDSTLTSSDHVVCLLTSSLTCANPAIAVSTAITPTFYPSPGSTITPANPGVCPGDSIQICAPAGNPTYQWSTGASTQCIAVKFTGLYSVTSTNVNLCTAVASATLSAYNTPAPPNIQSNANSVFTTASAANYQWYFNSTAIQGATTASYIPLQDGPYYVAATDSNGCVSNSNTLTFNQVGINELTSVSHFEVNPNPSNGQFTISFEANGVASISIKVFDPAGRTVKTEDNLKVSGSFSKEMDMGIVAPGIYIVQLISGDKTLNSKLEISK